jgi:hypothetical protein
VVTRVLTGSAVVAFFVVVLVTVAALQERDTPRSGVLASSSPQSTPTAAATALTTSRTGPLLRRAGSGTGYDRISSTEGGWSIEIPEKWFAQAGQLHGGEIGSFDMNKADYSGNAPAADQLRIRLTLMLDDDHVASLADLGRKGGLSSHGNVVEQVPARVAGQDAVRTVINSGQPPGLFDVPHVYWHLRSPYQPDRFFVIDAWPASGPLRPVAEHAAATFEVFAPTVTATTPLSRSEILAKASTLLNNGGRIDRIAAKLVSHKEFELAASFGRSFTVDPDDLVWVVVATGDFASMSMGGPAPRPGSSPAVPARDRLHVSVMKADTGDGFGFMAGPDRTWPAWFDGLKDRAS